MMTDCNEVACDVNMSRDACINNIAEVVSAHPSIGNHLHIFGVLGNGRKSSNNFWLIKYRSVNKYVDIKRLASNLTHSRFT